MRTNVLANAIVSLYSQHSVEVSVAEASNQVVLLEEEIQEQMTETAINK